jgi:drug/metabolite transporter (DMT)-like permease
MWFVYALSAAVIWGVSYAASGRAIERGISPIVFFTLYAISGTVFGILALTTTGKLATFPDEIRGIGKDWTWLAVAVVTSGIGALLIYMAIGEKNATVASLIEISYPVFVAFFAWLFFRETQFNFMTVIGGLLIIGGVAVVFLGNKN